MKRYKILSFDNSDGNWTGRPRTICIGTQLEMAKELKRLRAFEQHAFRYVKYTASDADRIE